MTIKYPRVLNPETICAIDRLISVASVPTGQGERVARFLLAWWNSDDWGGFCPLDLRGVDAELSDAMLTVLAHLAKRGGYPDDYGYGEKFDQLCSLWAHLKRSKGETEEQKMHLVAAVLAAERRGREIAQANGPRRRIDMLRLPPPVPRPVAK